MAADSPRDSVRPPRQTAAEVAAMVAAQVRSAIESAERSAQELRLRALDSASADSEEVDRTAAMVLGKLDRIEDQIGELLRVLRDEVERIWEEGRRAAVPTPAVPPNRDPGAQPAPASPDAAPAAHAPPPARRGRFGRRGKATAPSCAVCGRNAQPGDEDLDRWVHTADSSLCPNCRDERWELPPGAALPYRPRNRT